MRVRDFRTGKTYFSKRDNEQEWTLESMIEYFRMNPVRRGLCSRPEDWEFSSARWHAGIRPARVEIERTLPMIYGKLAWWRPFGWSVRRHSPRPCGRRWFFEKATLSSAYRACQPAGSGLDKPHRARRDYFRSRSMTFSSPALTSFSSVEFLLYCGGTSSGFPPIGLSWSS